MANKIIKYPFNAIFTAFSESRNTDTKKTIFKQWLESYIKLITAVHVSWLLKNKNNSVPLNIRVLLVQFFQKPPSIGTCNSISRSINNIIKNETNEEDNWFSFASFFELNQKVISRLIELRNADAHAYSSIDKENLLEIRELMRDLLSNPLFRNTTLIASNFKKAEESSITLPAGLQELEASLIFLKDKVLLDGEAYELETDDLCLFPIIIGNKQSEIFTSEENGAEVSCENNVENSVSHLLIWNQRKGKKGVYQNYFGNENEKIELDKITNIAGFPYEDWKKTANPIYLNYLQYRNNTFEEMLNDESVRIDQWHEEYKLAIRLEKDIDLLPNEKISDVDYVKGLLIKINHIKKDETKVFYHKIIFELRDSLGKCDHKDKIYILDKIFHSTLFLYKDAKKNNEKANFNNYYISAMKQLPGLNYLGYPAASYFKEIMGGNNLIIKRLKKKVIKIRLFLLSMFLFFFASFYFTSGFILFLILVPTIFLIFFLLKKYINSAFQFIPNKILTKSQIENSLVINWCGNLNQNHNQFLLGKLSILKDFDIKNIEVFFALVNRNLSNYSNQTDNKTKTFFNFIYNEFNKYDLWHDFQKISLRYNYLGVSDSDEKNKSYKEVFYGPTSLQKKDMNRFKNGKIESLSDYQKSYLYNCLNKILWKENIIRTVNWAKKIKENDVSVTSSNLLVIEDKKYTTDNGIDPFFWCETNNFKNDWQDYNFLMGYLSAVTKNYQNSIKHYKECTISGSGNLKLYSWLNLAKIYGVTGQVKNYITTYYQLNDHLKYFSEEEKKVVGVTICEHINDETLRLKKMLTNNNLKIFDNLFWTERKDFGHLITYSILQKTVNMEGLCELIFNP